MGGSHTLRVRRKGRADLEEPLEVVHNEPLEVVHKEPPEVVHKELWGRVKEEPLEAGPKEEWLAAANKQKEKEGHHRSEVVVVERARMIVGRSTSHSGERNTTPTKDVQR